MVKGTIFGLLELLTALRIAAAATVSPDSSWRLDTDSRRVIARNDAFPK